MVKAPRPRQTRLGTCGSTYCKKIDVEVINTHNREKIQNGIEYGFLDSSIMALEEYKPRLLINDIDRGEKVLTSVVADLTKCDEFMISVAFITNSGVTVLLNTLSDLEQRGVKGRIIASQYQNFTDPIALKRLLRFKNIELRIVTEDKANMHTKGYIFRKDEKYSIIVGSSNLTQNALCENKEWNLKVSSCRTGGIVNNTVFEFETMFELATQVNDNWLATYLQIYRTSKKSEHLAELYAEKKITQFTTIKPNSMQDSALQALSDSIYNN
jgi:HKD family nuclease